ncbi:helix-hairpin-helix domain-containing protein [Chloroflexota bacterium]
MEDTPSNFKKIDLNQASQETLTTLPGIGPALAARIIRFREEVHPFAEGVEVAAVPGISEEMYRRFADRVTVPPEKQAVTSAVFQPDAPSSDEQAVDSEPESFSPVDEAIEEPALFVDSPSDFVPSSLPPLPEPDEIPPLESLPSTPPPPPQPTNAGSWRFWLVAIVGAVGGALLALLVMLSINGTLDMDMATQPQIIELNDEVSALKRQSDTLNDEIGQLRDRVSQIEALSGRMQKAEAEIETMNETLAKLNEQIATLEQDMQQVQTGIEALNEGLSIQGEQVAILEQDTAQIRETVEQIQDAADRFDSFLTGLRDLLLATDETATPASSTDPSPIPTSSPTDSPTATRTPRPTRTPTATPIAITTPLLLPTFTPLSTVALETPSASKQTTESPSDTVTRLTR